nr:hypothetical protein [Tanacetum cinerariifolium]
MGGEQEDEELYGDLNLNLDRRDAKMTEAQIIQEMNEVHMTLTTELPVVQQQISSISSDLVSKFINPTSDTIINLILNPNVQSNIPINVSVSVTTKTPSSDTTIPQPHILIIQPQQQTHDSTTTTPILTTSLPKIPNYASLFGKSAQVEEHGPRVDDLEEPFHQEFNTRNDDVSPIKELKIHNLTQDVLTSPTYDLMKGTCKSVVELEYHMKEVFKDTNDQLDWHNPERRSRELKSKIYNLNYEDEGC